MQSHAGAISTITGIANHRMPQPGHVGTGLMLSTGLQLNFKQRPILESTQGVALIC